MRETFYGRELFTLETLGVRVQGTCHFPPGQASGMESTFPNQKGTGILILVGLLVPRTANGDSAVYWADSLAKCGYTCFRVDLPGACDSGGDAPVEFMSYINSGSYEAVAAEIMKQLVVRYNLSALIVMGHCSGTVTALFAAPSCKECRGLVLLEPYFHILPPVPTDARASLSRWAASNRLGGLLSNLFDVLKALRLRLRRTELPGNANIPLLKRWKGLASSGLPILVIKAPDKKTSGAKPRLGEFDYLTHVIGLGGSRSRVDVKVIEGASHSFADRSGRLAVRLHTEGWLNEYFPQESADASLVQNQDHQVQESLAR